ncbi:F0F1 ATP synthase subunit epsilon [Butyricimonas hominis]|uniref:FoF1 ATP synthase subunit delta/epsilon n=1 Tax=Butyricimonas TaxID=574697 RepID=UPI0027B8A3CB|nr:F0F1 ATP synthase subunit epsilon [Odoribacter splanchnicus]
MQLTIVAPCGVLCHTTVEKVSLPGALGAFTVLPGHAPLIAQLSEGKISYTSGTKEHEQEIRRGFVKIERDTVEANVELAEP